MHIIPLTAHRTNYGSQREIKKIEYIVLHYTANDGDRSANNARYFHNNANLRASAHYFVDDVLIYQSVPDDYVAYSVGATINKEGRPVIDTSKGGGKYYGLCTNANSISIELCDTERNGVYNVTKLTKKNAIELTRFLMSKYNIPIENVIRHFDVTGKLCPVYWIDFGTWESEFKSKLKSAGWRKDAVGWWYEDENGQYPKNCWMTIDGKDYYFKADGYMASNEFIKSEKYDINRALYYVYPEGYWDGSTYRWEKDDVGWWIGKVGTIWYPKSSWYKIDGHWYYFDEKGYMVTGTKTIDGRVYSFNSNGELVG